MKKLILLFTLFLLFQIIDVNAFTCSVKNACNSNENLILYMYNNVDTHVSSSKTNVNWPYKLCCTELVDSCSGLYTQLIKLYLSQDGHASLINNNYPQRVCLSIPNAVVGQGNIECNYRENSNCNSDEQCVLTLSGKDDAHVSACDVQGSYSNKLCCKATPCPKDFVWDPLANNGKGACISNFAECSNLDKTRGSQRVCVNVPPYTDAKNLCVVEAPIPYERACCFATKYNNDDYYRYNNIVVKKLVI